MCWPSRTEVESVNQRRTPMGTITSVSTPDPWMIKELGNYYLVRGVRVMKPATDLDQNRHLPQDHMSNSGEREISVLFIILTSEYYGNQKQACHFQLISGHLNFIL